MLAHYKKRGMIKAWCGFVPMLAFDDWARVTCPACRQLGVQVHEVRTQPSEPDHTNGGQA
jgi:hypothetical protein